MQNVNYNRFTTPPAYTCSECGATGVKLWRPYQTMAPSLYCAACAATEEKRLDWSMSDQIGWMVPAVPDEEGVGFWGYTSVPAAGCRWWHNLEPKSPAPRHAEYLRDDAGWLHAQRVAYWRNYRYGAYVRREMRRSYVGECIRLGTYGRTRSGLYRVDGKTYRTKALALAAVKRSRRELLPPALA